MVKILYQKQSAVFYRALLNLQFVYKPITIQILAAAVTKILDAEAPSAIYREVCGTIVTAHVDWLLAE